MAIPELEAEFKRVLGRMPTASELGYYNKLLSDPNAQFSPYQAGQALEGLPEAQMRGLEADTTALGNRLGASDDYFLQRAFDTANSNFRRLGRPDSSGLSGAYMSSARDLAAQRQQALANFYGRGLNQIRGVQQNYGQQAFNRPTGLQDEERNYQRDLNVARETANIQRNQYNDYLNMMRRQQRGQFLGGLAGAGLGAIAGSYFGPAGSKFGASLLGGQLGGSIGRGFGGY